MLTCIRACKMTCKSHASASGLNEAEMQPRDERLINKKRKCIIATEFIMKKQFTFWLDNAILKHRETKGGKFRDTNLIHFRLKKEK